ncbi:MAG: hypothetical protein B0W54_17515 [Cellvibrio sp. 79]|nr:MAG: hypothetical protein B0W54_17515 [Cellvibrio sp. 79]
MFVLEFNIIGYKSPHAVVINSCGAILRNASQEPLLFQDQVDLILTKLLDTNRHWPEAVLRNEYGPEYFIQAYWNDEDEYDGAPVNAIKKFPKGSQYVVYIMDDFSHWNDKNPYVFPAVAYSKPEIQAWLLWSIKKLAVELERNFEDIRELVEAHINIEESKALMIKKLNGELAWELGPTRIHEPNFALWHEMTKNHEMNAWIRKWLD